MTFGTAVLLLAAAIIGIALSCNCLRNHRTLRIVCIVLLSLTALMLVCYIGLTLIFVDAVQNLLPAV